ncbi:MAG: mannose-1-phosphate guanylyltransferase [Thermodesulfobacteriota bacterium]|nr:mannose-1-phosphate guanylyltransferase [Thermodesulfobacteriota bacterium]
MYAVIMAGGKGTRFWPLSREKRPKHLLSITGEKSIIKYTVERIVPLVPEDNIMIVTGESHSDETKKEITSLPEENIIVEPMGRNTAPCIGLAAIHIRKKNPDAIMVVLPSDHLIGNGDNFVSVLDDAVEMAERGDYLVTIGIQPTKPETGYGYIERDKTFATIGNSQIYSVKSFREKPDLKTAETFFKDGGFYWNSGMFIWKVSTLLESIEKFLPDLYESLLKMENCLGTDREREIVAEVYGDIQPVSIDYGIMEKAENVLMIPGDFGWSDVGSWDVLWEVLGKDENGNVVKGNVLSIDTSDSLVFGKDKLITLVGVKDLIVVETSDSLLICDKNASQDVKRLVEKLEKENMKEYL